MKLKFANSLLVAALVASAAGCFTSCKDTDEDMLNQVTNEINTLQDKYDKDLAALEAALQDLQSCKTTCTVEIAALKAAVADIQSAIDKAKGNYGSMAERFAAIESAIAELQALTSIVNDLQGKYNDLVPLVNKALADAEAAYLLAQSLTDENTGLLAQAKAYVDAEIETLKKDILAQMDKKIDQISLTVSENTAAIAALKLQVEDLAKRVTNLERTVNSVLVQEVTSPIIGSLSAPIDVRTMILFNYYGQSDHAASIPDFRPLGTNFGYSEVTEDRNGLISANSEALLGNPEVVNVNAGEIFLSDNGDFGKVYFTANPTNIDLTQGYTLNLVNSQGEASKVVLTNIKPSDHVINFGLSRADVTLWEADATVAEEDVKSLEIDLEPGLKTAVKDAVTNRSLSSVADMVRLVYRTMNNNPSLPALGLQIGWSDADGVARTAYSEFNTAANTFRPLSYSTLHNSDFSSVLPVLPNFDNLILKVTDRINAYFDEKLPNKLHFEITLDKEFDLETLNLEIVFNANDITVNVNGVTTQVDGIDDLIGAINDALADVNGYTESVKNDVQNYINDIVASLNEEVNSKIEDVLNSIQNKINGKFTNIAERFRNYYSLFEKVYNRVAILLKDPNHYMQAWMMYADPKAGVMNRLSSSKAVPTILTGNGDAITLIPTTYNGDLLSPAYKKYVAITNVYYQNARNVSAENGDANCVYAMQKANKQLHMNEVFAGENQTVPFEFMRGHNYTYEIFYQALDYRGYTSTVKYYVNVK